MMSVLCDVDRAFAAVHVCLPDDISAGVTAMSKQGTYYEDIAHSLCHMGQKRDSWH